MIEIKVASSPVGSEVFSLIALIVIGIGVLLLISYYLPLRQTPAFYIVPIFFALGLPVSIVLLVPIDLASNAREADEEGRGIRLPESVLIILWRISYWLTFCLTWFILPLLAEYADAGYRESKARLMWSLKRNLVYQAGVFGTGFLGMIYFFISRGASLNTLKGLVMALAYFWGLIFAIFLMGHGLVSIPRRFFRRANLARTLKRIQSRAAKVHEKMEDAIYHLEDLEAQIVELSQRKTGSARKFQDWIEELAYDSHLPELRPRTLTRRMSEPQLVVPQLVTEEYLAELSRNLLKARHTRTRYINEWDQILRDASETEKTMAAYSSGRIELGQAAPDATAWQRLTLLTPKTRFFYKCYFLPALWRILGSFFSLASFCIVWSEIVKSINPLFSIIAVTVVDNSDSERGQIGITGQIIAACWILYMCVAALISLTEVKVWRGRALVRGNTHGESAMWYSYQVARLSVPIAFNFLTFLDPDTYEWTVFYQFLGKLIVLTPLGQSFDIFWPTFILVPVCAAVFGLYGKFQNWVGYGGVIDDNNEDNESGYGTGSWREGRNLIERELLHGGSSLVSITASFTGRSYLANPNNHSGPDLVLPPAQRQRAAVSSTDRHGHTERILEEENFFEAIGHRFRNTLDTVPTPKWLQSIEGLKRPKWMGGNNNSEPARGSWFRSSEQGRVRL